MVRPEVFDSAFRRVLAITVHALEPKGLTDLRLALNGVPGFAVEAGMAVLWIVLSDWCLCFIIVTLATFAVRGTIDIGFLRMRRKKLNGGSGHNVGGV